MKLSDKFQYCFHPLVLPDFFLDITELTESTNDPEFCTFPKSVTIDEGSSAKFTCVFKESTVQGR